MTPPAALPRLILVLPAHNPPRGWATVALERFTVLSALRPAWHWVLVVVDDGSTHGTASDEREVLTGPLAERCVWLHRPRNDGKGRALRDGVAAVDGDAWIFTDIDFPYTDASLLAVADRLAAGEATLVAGVRRSASRAGAPASRRVLSRLLRAFNRRVLRLPVADTQCGLKGFDRAGHALLLAGKVDGYLFDLEFLCRARRRGTVTFASVEVEWRSQPECHAIPLGVLAREAGSLLRILAEAWRP